jgi:hypothetical protein
LSNDRFIQLIQHFPGIVFTNKWVFLIQDPGAVQPLLDVLNVRDLLTDIKDLPPIGGQYTIQRLGDFTAIRNKTSWPRAFFASQIVPLSSNEEFIEYLTHHGDNPFVAMSPDEFEGQNGIASLAKQPNSEIAAAEHYQLGVNSTAFDVQATSAGTVCLTEEQAKDFTATVNGVATKCLR